MSEVTLLEWSEIQKHNTRNDLWMVIDGKVYDSTKFLDEHPGGEEVLLEQGGVDASEAFEEIGHSDDARDLLKAMYKGDLKPSEKVKPAPASTTKAPAPSSYPKPAAKASGNNTILYALVPVVAILGYVIYRYLQ